jgi:uncharacterized membrane protein
MLRQQLHHRHTGVSPGFRPRGTDVTRIEGFSDAVFAFALTLIVVSLEVPHTFEELMRSVRGFPAFAISFVFLMQIWFKHYGFFRRYGLQDMPTRLLNAALLFIVLFYVYPLKYLWTHMVLGGTPAMSVRDEMELNALERFDTRAAVVENVLMAAVPLVSALLAVVLPANLVGLAGTFYLIYAPLMTWNGIREGRGRRLFEAAAKG